MFSSDSLPFFVEEFKAIIDFFQHLIAFPPNNLRQKDVIQAEIVSSTITFVFLSSIYPQMEHFFVLFFTT